MSAFIPAVKTLILGGSGTASAALTGSTDETIQATVTIPAGTIGANSAVKMTALWSMTNNANNKTLRIRLGGIAGTELFSLAVASSASYGVEKLFFNRATQASQVLTGVAIPRNQGNNSSTATLTATVDTSAAQDLVFTAQLANGADSATLEFYLVELVKP